MQLNHKLGGRSESATASTAGHTALIADSVGASVWVSYGEPSALLHFIYVAIAGFGLPLWNFFSGKELSSGTLVSRASAGRWRRNAAVAKRANCCRPVG
jgi:hypothetical protein